MPPWDRPVRRRAALSAACGVLLSGCSGPQPAPPNPSRSADPALVPARPAASSPGAVALPDVTPYRVLRGEVEPACKVAAARAVTTALTWTPGERGTGLSGRLHDAGALPSLAHDLDALVKEHHASALEIVYPQYGGLSRADASVILVARQTWRTSAGALPQVRDLTLDIRLRKLAGRWAAERAYVPTLPPAGTGQSQAAQRLLRNEALVFPAAATADLLGGLTDPRLAAMLERLSRRWRLHVQVLRSGHPRNVYGTRRVSNHTKGRAVDVWAIDGIPVVRQRASVCSAVMRDAAAAGADEIGGPVAPDGRSGHRPFFTNALHRDHLHLGFEKG